MTAHKYYFLSFVWSYLCGLGQNSYSHGTGVHPALFFRLGNPLNSMNSGLKLHLLVALRTTDAGRGVTESSCSH